MKLLNRSLLYLSLAFLFIIGIWAIVFYINLKDEIRDSIDDGLDNNRILIIQKIQTDTILLYQNEFGGNNFEIHPISKQSALQFKDKYKDTLMYRINENDLEPVRILHTAFEHDANHYHLKVISSLVEEDDLVEDSFWSVVWLFLILICSIVIINNVVLRKVWNPFYDILKRLKTYRLDSEETPINIVTKTREFTELQKASNTLISHSKEVYASQKQFTENASHELQTPLAIIINKLELLLEGDHLEESDARSIAEIINIAERLSLLNKSLLLLAKIENKQFPNLIHLDINSLAKEFLSNFKAFTDFKDIKIRIKEQENLLVKMDAALAEILVSNLIKNAIFHNVEEGGFTLTFSQKQLIICNTGNKTALNPKTIFNRFQKYSATNQSTGLGLAVCKAICEFYSIGLIYRFIENKHCFILNFEKIASRD